MMFKKIKILFEVFSVDLKKKYATRKLESALNSKGLNVDFDQNFLIRNTSFGGDNKLAGNGKIIDSSLGRFSYVAFDSIVSYSEIGSFCSIGPRCIIGFGNHPTNRLSTHPLFYQREKVWEKYGLASKEAFDPRDKIVIGNDVWIGANCFIKDGVKIGNGAIIAAGSVVVSDVPAFAIFGGIPAKHIKDRFHKEMHAELEQTDWYSKDVDDLIKHRKSFRSVTENATDLRKILKALSENE